MKIKLDENMPAGLAAELRSLGHEVDTVPEEQLGGRDDTTVWSAAQASGRFFITQDLDFSDVRKFEPGNHHGILLVPRLPGRRDGKQRHW
jgi:predicted nuclease of predicted toxin-antitoxin system